MKLLRWDNNEIIYENKNINNVKELVEEAVKKGINLSYANLYNANLENANLYNANLSNANLSNVYLSYAYLENANLSNVYLSYAYLENANLNNANLYKAYLENANLYKAYLENANLYNANLCNANLYNANLNNANLKNVDLPNFQIVPEIGKFVAWKAARGYILKLGIPSDAKRTSNLKNRKCRVEKAVVLGIYNLKGNLCDKNTICEGLHDSNFIYKYCPNYTPIKSDKYNDDIRLDCTNGIHFFMTVREALEWNGIKDKKIAKKILKGGKE